MPPLRSLRRDGERLGALFGHHDRVLELRGEAAVLGAHRPAVALAKECIARAGVDHRLDGEANARLKSLAARFGRGGGIVGNRWRLMKLPADAVADIFLHDGEAVFPCVTTDRFADLA